MPVLVLAIVALPVGLALDWLITYLAVPLDDGPPPETEDQPHPHPHPHGSLGSEAGLIAVAADYHWLQRTLVVGLTVILFALAGARYHDPAQLAAVTALLCVFLLCAATDILTYRVPNVVTYPAMVGALLAAALMPGGNAGSAFGGALLAGAVLLVPSIFTGGIAMGMGDVKLAVVAGLALGFTFVLPALVFMALGGGVVAAALLVTHARKRRQVMPYAPFISAGAIATLLWQGTVFVSLH